MKQKIILFVLLIGLGLGVKGQTWLTVGNTLQRTTDGTGFKYRFSLGSPGLYNLSDSIRNGGKTYTAGYGMSLVGQQFRVDTSAIVSKAYLVNRLATGQTIGANTTGNSATTSAVSGTVNYIPKFTSSNAIGNSLIFDNGTNIGIGTSSPTQKLDINGMLRVSGDFGSSGGTGIKLNNINQFGYSELVIDNDTPISGGGFVFGYGGTASGVPNFAYFTQRRNAPIIFQTNNLTRIMIDGSGNVSVNSLAGTGESAIGVDASGTLKRISVNRKPITNKTANYTATATDYTITGSATSASFTITLPTAASSYDATSATGQIYNFKKTDSSANTITIQANGSETIDGTNTKTIATQYGGFTVQSTGSGWIIIN